LLEVNEEGAEGFVGLGRADESGGVRQAGQELLPEAGFGCVWWAGVEDVEAGGVAGELRGEDDGGEGEHGEGGFVAGADDEEVAAALAAEGDLGGAFDGVGFAEPESGCGCGLECGGLEELAEESVGYDVSGGVAFEDDGFACGEAAAVAGMVFGQGPDLAEPEVAFFVREPYDLEGAVTLEGAAFIVVDGFAGPGEVARCGVVFVEDEEGVGLVALEGDADDHLAHGGACEGVGAAEGLGAEQDVDAEGAALANDAIEEEGGVLGDAVVFDEEFLELVDEEEDAWEWFGWVELAVAREVLDACFSEEVAAAAEFLVDALEDAETEFAVAFDGDDACVREFVGGVAFEFDAFFEVDEVKLDLVWAVPEGEVGDDDVEEGGLAGAGLARDEAVLAGAAAECEVLEFGCAGAADGDTDFVGGVGGPELVGWGCGVGEGGLDLEGVAAVLADAVEQMGGEVGRWRWFEFEAGALEVGVGQGELVLVCDDPAGGFAEFVGDEFGRGGSAEVPVEEEVDAAARSAGCQAEESFDGEVGEVDGKVGDDEEVIFFGEATCALVVFGEGGVVVAQVHLGDFFDVFVQFGEAIFDLGGLGPDAAVDEAVFVVGQVHEAGEVLSEADGVEDGEGDAAGGRGGEQAEDEVVEGGDGGFGAGLCGFQDEGAFVGEGQEEGELELGGLRKIESVRGEVGAAQGGQVHGEPGEGCGVGEGVGWGPMCPGWVGPGGEEGAGGAGIGEEAGVEWEDGLVPVGADAFPSLAVVVPEALELLLGGGFEGLALMPEFVFQSCQLMGEVGFQLAEAEFVEAAVGLVGAAGLGFDAFDGFVLLEAGVVADLAPAGVEGFDGAGVFGVDGGEPGLVIGLGCLGG